MLNKYQWGAVAAIVVILALLLIPPIEQSRGDARRSMSKSNLKHVGFAFHNHHDGQGTLPRGIIYDADARPLHGWHTAMLPYLEHRGLYERIDLESPWDDPVNAEAVSTALPEFRNWQIEEEFDDAGRALSHYAANVHLVSGREPMALGDVTDGLHNTILAGEVNAEFRAWGHPYSFRDPRLGLDTVPRGFGGPWHDTSSGDGTILLMADGAVYWFDNDIDPAVLNALATPAGGEPPGLHEVP